MTAAQHTGRSHVVLPEVDSQPYTSLRHPSTPRVERYRLGHSLRHRVPRSMLGQWEEPADRPDVVAQITESHRGRRSELIATRVERMVASPYGFLRGSAVVMAEDLAHLPATGISPVICGDAHFGNFGFYASPERDLVLDLNDFDEAHPGGWEWDLRRLVASIWVASRQNGQSEQHCATAVESCSAAYRNQMKWLASQPLLARSYERLDLDRLQTAAADASLQAQIERAAHRAQGRTSDRALPRFTTTEGTGRRIVQEPPLITHLDDDEAELLAGGLDDYLATLAPHWRRVLGGYTLIDFVHKVVGVGSVGLRAYVALLEGSSPSDVVFLQLKQARRSVLAPHVHGESAWHAHQGQRVVEYQQALQTVSDPLLGWTTVAGRQYYVRQFRNMKGTIPLDALKPSATADYAGICGQLLAKAHARSSGASMIAAYVGGSDKVDLAMSSFARAYADQTERDHQRMVDAVRRGHSFLAPA
ncbi:hypothetical protein BA895_01070 [Humibacillus sp. DSM 29435]|uniref:DUF2252 domain-containing protein n=1 Tax=Humibacillus sp. DSM 29435 TaxID=1869167 RepID=UPI000872F461|nr:DUF2252 domain-containing protein [Humibacillus sp. DSM 29435]OFE18807.1 hypothetical protein BA895_01070 [Humibacillus sp. DSM 29435]